MTQVTRNGWMTDEVYAYVLECLGKDLECDPDERDISEALSRRTGADVHISFTHECRINVQSEFDSINELLILDHLDTVNNSADEICCAIYAAVDACVNSAKCTDIVYYDEETQYYPGPYYNEPDDYHWHNDYCDDEDFGDWYY